MGGKKKYAKCEVSNNIDLCKHQYYRHMYGDTKFLLKRETEANKDGYAATQVACKWAGAMIEKDTRIWAGAVSSKNAHRRP